jgi:hypothetical protein
MAFYDIVSLDLAGSIKLNFVKADIENGSIGTLWKWFEQSVVQSTTYLHTHRYLCKIFCGISGNVGIIFSRFFPTEIHRYLCKIFCGISGNVGIIFRAFFPTEIHRHLCM